MVLPGWWGARAGRGPEAGRGTRECCSPLNTYFPFEVARVVLFRQNHDMLPCKNGLRNKHLHKKLPLYLYICQRHCNKLRDVPWRWNRWHQSNARLPHGLVLEREQHESRQNMIIKAWPQNLGYSDRVRITGWLLHKYIYTALKGKAK